MKTDTIYYFIPGGKRGGITALVNQCVAKHCSCVGLAFCSPTDEFCEFRGEGIAVLRQLQTPLKFKWLGLSSSKAIFNDIVVAILTHAWDALDKVYPGMISPDMKAAVPAWTREWIAEWIAAGSHTEFGSAWK